VGLKVIINEGSRSLELKVKAKVKEKGYCTKGETIILALQIHQTPENAVF